MKLQNLYSGMDLKKNFLEYIITLMSMRKLYKNTNYLFIFTANINYFLSNYF